MDNSNKNEIVIGLSNIQTMVRLLGPLVDHSFHHKLMAINTLVADMARRMGLEAPLKESMAALDSIMPLDNQD